MSALGGRSGRCGALVGLVGLQSQQLPVEPPRGRWYAPAVRTLSGLVEGFFENLPLVFLALLVLAGGVILSHLVARGAERALRRRSADRVAERLTFQLVRTIMVIAAILLALSVAGVPVGSAVATLGLAGIAIAVAVQSILENFISGIVLLMRKPFRAGDQIKTNDYEGTVEDLDLRVTRLLTYEGELVLIPNADVFKNPIVNLTRRGRRRSCVEIGVDYRDDHDDAREVILRAIADVPGVLAAPEPQVLLTELGDSSVNFEILYWTLPDIRSVRSVQDRVLAAAKRGIQDAGMTIPWPIRTVAWDGPLRTVDEQVRALDERAR
ncbi:MAG: mechanosensitive ion channel family protein [Actinomycetota bacterium]|nr:mechanosensitive ion channel family protein [Actinomycetota bacterium]